PALQAVAARGAVVRPATVLEARLDQEGRLGPAPIHPNEGWEGAERPGRSPRDRFGETVLPERGPGDGQPQERIELAGSLAARGIPDAALLAGGTPAGSQEGQHGEHGHEGRAAVRRRWHGRLDRTARAAPRQSEDE